MTVPVLLPDPTCLHLRYLDVSDTLITAVVATAFASLGSHRCACSPGKDTKAFTERAREPQHVGIYTRLFCPIRLHTRICASYGEVSSFKRNSHIL
jgi:hypothetical protein